TAQEDGPMPTARIGFVGGGDVAERHAESLARMDGVSVAAVAEARPKPREAFVRRTGARPYTGHDAMLDAEELDALYVCVPPYAHGAPEAAAIERGLPFFVEAPLSVTAEVAERIAAAVRERGLITAVGYHWRYFGTVEEAAGVLAAGPPALVTGHWLNRFPGTGRWVDEEPGGWLVGQLTPLLDLARLLAGEYEIVHAQETRGPAVTGGDDRPAVTCALRFASGAIGTLSSAPLLRRGDRLGMEFARDGVVVRLTGSELVVDDGTARRAVVCQDDPLAREAADFVTAVRGGPNRIRAPYEEALRTHRLALTAAEAARPDTVAAGPPEPVIRGDGCD
ncbi:MAG TPA: Gfo/Idh/MocA family oxidoreductase, partial [Streptomyces sp.]|nr:Gfo/Idh/MocA family oxidoreductase [Streptomyces sp.]